MHRFCLGFLMVGALIASPASAQILFSYEDLDPDATSPVTNGVTISGTNFDAERVAVGDVDVSTATQPYMALLTDPTTIDVAGFIGKNFEAFVESYIPAASTINAGDSIYLQVDYFNDVVGGIGEGNFERFTAGFLNDTSPRDTWSGISINSLIPEFTPNSDPVNRANVQLVLTDGGFAGGVPNDSGPGTFTLIDNFRYTISDSGPPSPIFYQDDAPPSTTTDWGGIILEQAVDPLDESNTVGLVAMGGTGNYVNLNGGAAVDVSTFEGQRFRAAFDYLVPADTAFDENDTFWVQVGFGDPVSGSTPQGANNSASEGFVAPGNVADGMWRTIEVTGVIPPDTNGATFSIVMTDDGFVGGSPNTFGDVMYVDNLIFEAIETVPGDFNDDGVVDGIDYAIWRENLGAEAPAEPYEYEDSINLSGEALINFAGDGANGVNSADFQVWLANFGAAASPGAIATPEPGALGGLVSLLVLAGGAARRRGPGALGDSA